MIQLDLSNMTGFVPGDWFTSRQAALESACTMLEKGNGPGGEFTGWVHLPRDYDKEEFVRIQRAAQKIQSDSKALVVIGIGGSYLGARAVVELLKSPNYNQNKKATPDLFLSEMVFPPMLYWRRLNW